MFGDHCKDLFTVKMISQNKGYPFDSLELYDLELVFPKFPFRQTPICTKGYAFEPYDYNGWVYELEPGNYCVVFNTTPMIPVSKQANCLQKYTLSF